MVGTGSQNIGCFDRSSNWNEQFTLERRIVLHLPCRILHLKGPRMATVPVTTS